MVTACVHGRAASRNSATYSAVMINRHHSEWRSRLWTAVIDGGATHDQTTHASCTKSSDDGFLEQFVACVPWFAAGRHDWRAPQNQRPSKPAARLQPGAGLVNYRTVSALTGESLLHVGTLSKSDRRGLLDAAAGVGGWARAPSGRKDVRKVSRNTVGSVMEWRGWRARSVPLRSSARERC